MRKTDKKVDNQIIKQLTWVCEFALKEIEGFQWLTHTVNYQRFPQSLLITCVFDNDLNLTQFMNSTAPEKLRGIINEKLAEIKIKLPNVKQQITYDSEQSCQRQHQGNWTKRLS